MPRCSMGERGTRRSISRRETRSSRTLRRSSPPSGDEVRMSSVAGLAMSNIAWDPADDTKVAALLRKEGCTGVEIAPTKWREKPLEATARDVASYRAHWEGFGLPIIAMQSLLFGRPELQLFGESNVRDEMLTYLRGI